MQTVTKLELIKESKMRPDIEEGIKEVLCLMMQEVIVHKIDENNMIFEIDYDKFVREIKKLLQS